MADNKQAIKVFKALQKTYPEAKIALDFTNPIELLVATVLSAQCTDVRVNLVTQGLFNKYPTVVDYAHADFTEFEKDIHSTGFFRNKAKNIITACQIIIKKHGGKMPKTMEELIQLPGVGRKTANVILGNAFNVPGIVVDTHVLRLSNRIGLAEGKDPVKIEFALNELIPKRDWTLFSHLLISHGRKTCKARKPTCQECVILKNCAHPQV